MLPKRCAIDPPPEPVTRLEVEIKRGIRATAEWPSFIREPQLVAQRPVAIKVIAQTFRAQFRFSFKLLLNAIVRGLADTSYHPPTSLIMTRSVVEDHYYFVYDGRLGFFEPDITLDQLLTR